MVDHDALHLLDPEVRVRRRARKPLDLVLVHRGPVVLGIGEGHCQRVPTMNGQGRVGRLRRRTTRGLNSRDCGRVRTIAVGAVVGCQANVVAGASNQWSVRTRTDDVRGPHLAIKHLACVPCGHLDPAKR